MSQTSTGNSSSRWGIGIGVHDIVVLIAFYSLLVVQAPSFANDPGLGWHLRTGEWIWNKGSIPLLDPFLAAPNPRPWVSDQWLSDLVLWAFYSFGGWPFLYASFAVIYAAIHLMFLYAGVSRASVTAISATLACIVSFKIGQIHFVARPVVFGFLVFSVVLLFWRQFMGLLRAPLERLKSRGFELLVILPVIFAFWANLHPSFVLGLIFIAASLVGVALDSWLLRDPELGEDVAPFLKWGILILFVSAAATLLNPYFYELHLSILSLGKSSFFMRYHQEWLSPDFLEPEGLFTYLTVAIFILSLVISDSLRARMGLRVLLPLLLFLLLGLRAQRVLPFYAMVAAFPLAEAIVHLGRGEWVSRLARNKWWVDRLAAIEFREFTTQRGIPCFFVIACLVLGDSLWNGRTLLYNGPYGPDPKRYPYTAVEVLRDLAAPSEPLVVAAPAAWGGFIAFAGGGQLKPVIDDRNTLLGESFYKEYDSLLVASKDWPSFITGLGATHLAWPVQSEFAQTIKREGRAYLVHEDEVAIVFDLRSEFLVADGNEQQ